MTTALGDDILSVVTALADQAVTQRKWQAEYEAKAAASDSVQVRALWERQAARACGTANAYENSVGMIRKYITPGYVRVVNGVTG